MNKPTDKIFINGQIHSMDNRKNIYQAIAISGERISALGTNAEILKLKKDSTIVYDLKGKTTIPGIIDTHSHLFRVAVSELKEEVFMPTSVKELTDFIKEAVKSLPKGEWLYFRNIYPTRLKEYRFPTLSELDEAAPNNPVYADGAYAGQANSYALRLLGIEESTPNPKIGRFIRDKSGKLTGGLFLCSDMVRKLLKPDTFSVEDYKKGILNLQHKYNQLGITSVVDGGTDEYPIKAFNDLYTEGKLTVRAVFTCNSPSIELGSSKLTKLRNAISTPEEWGKLSFYKIPLDGGILTGTAYMRTPYIDRSGVFGIDIDNFRGIIRKSAEEIVEYIDAAYNNNLQMTAHCIGSGAIDVFLDAYEIYQKKNNIKDKRFSIIHCDFTDSNTLKRIKELGLFILFQPAWHYCDGDILTQVLDNDAINTFQPYKQYIESGVDAAAGSDHMVKYDSVLSQNPYNPYLSLYNMVTRKTRAGVAIGTEHCVSRDEALSFYTSKAAAASFDEDFKGTLEVGKAADFAVLSNDYFTCAEDEIKKITSDLTVVGGKIAYCK